MESLLLHQFHNERHAHFGGLNGMELVSDYGDPAGEYGRLTETAGVLDLSCRGRLCLAGTDRVRFLHGQVTNDVNRLQVGQGCYAALITAKGKMISDLNIYRLQDELLLDFEPGLSHAVTQRLEQFVIADDVQVVDVASAYGLLTVQGPKAAEVIEKAELLLQSAVALPADAMGFISQQDGTGGEIYLMNHPRLGRAGYDIFAPAPLLPALMERLMAAAGAAGGGLAGWDAFERARIEAGLPRFSVDMDESNLPPEAGLETRAISYSKGCYIGQEILARLRTYGQVTKALRHLQFASDLPELPRKGDKLFESGKDVGYVTSATWSSPGKGPIGLGYVRRGSNTAGTELTLRAAAGESRVLILK